MEPDEQNLSAPLQGSEAAPAAVPANGGKPIRVESADGMTHIFEPGTSMEIIDRAMKNYAEQKKNKTTALGRFGQGLMDPIEGGGQIVANLLPADATKTLDAINNWISDKTGGLVRKLPEGGKNQQMRERETAYEKYRGANAGDLDWMRLLGGAANPINYIGGAPLKAEQGLAWLGSMLGNGAISGVVGGALQPATNENFVTEKAAQVGTGAALGGALGGVGAGISKGVEKIGEYIARNYPDNLASKAVETVLRRIRQDEKAGGLSATDALDVINSARKPLTLADVAGENTKALAGNVARQPGESRSVATQFLNNRDQQAATRLSADIAEFLGGDKTARQATEIMLQQRSGLAKPLYDQTFALQHVWTPRLDEFLSDPVIQTGLKRGYEIERMVSLAEGRPLTATQLGVDLDVAGAVKLVEKPNMRLLDMAKQGLDAMIADERNEITGRLTARGVALEKLRRSYVNELDKADTSGVYKKARETWAGYSANLDAVRSGRTSLARSPEENTALLNSMNAAQREFYRVGQADLLRERLAKAGFSSDESKSIIKNPWMRDQLRPAFKSDEAFNKFVDAVTAENTMFATRQGVLGGSQTAARVAEDANGVGGDLLAKGGKAAARLFHGDIFGAAKQAWQFYRDIGLRPNPELNEQISKILFTAQLPKETQQMLRDGPPLLYNPVSRALPAIESMANGAAAGAASGAAKLYEDRR